MTWAKVVVIAICLLSISETISAIQRELNRIYSALSDIRSELGKCGYNIGVIASNTRKGATDDD